MCVAVTAGLKGQDLRLDFVVLLSWIKMASGNSELVLPLLLGGDNTVRGILGFVSIPGNVAVFNQPVPVLQIYIRICPFTADAQVWDSFFSKACLNCNYVSNKIAGTSDLGTFVILQLNASSWWFWQTAICF